jgi:hydroxymethylbilane synthase
VRLGTRGSALALAQAGAVRARLAAQGEEVELEIIRTSGDERAGGAPAPETEDKERFVKEIDDALLDGRIDLALHSAKDVPSAIPGGLAIVGVPEREDARDALCGAGALDDLPEGAAVGTASLRRRALLLAVRPDLEVRTVRGNVDTRLRRLGEGVVDALVLAVAGLRRLGRTEGVPIPPATMLPAPGQGCLLLEARSGDAHAAELAGSLTDPSALVALTAERALVGRLEASCHTPVGAYAHAEGEELRVEGFAGTPDGARWIRDAVTGDPSRPAELGTQVAERMLAVGARELLDAAEAMDPAAR